MNLLERFVFVFRFFSYIVMGALVAKIQQIEDYMICFVNWETEPTLFGLPGKENWEWSISRTNWILNVWRQIYMEAKNTGLHFWVYSYKNWTFESFGD